MTISSSPDDFKEISDLKDSTTELQKSLSLQKSKVPSWAKTNESQKVGSVDEIPALKKDLMNILNEQLFSMLHQYIIEENDIESSAQFVSIMEEDDPKTVEKMRKLVQLENMSAAK